jgi:hypothetical protein
MLKQFESQFHDIKLVITGTDEPNNGRELWLADIYINGSNQTEKYFGNWNRLNWNLENYVMDSPGGNHVFIPAEGGGFVIKASTMEKIDLPCKGLSTIKFHKNDFEENTLIITYTDEVVRITLDALT